MSPSKDDSRGSAIRDSSPSDTHVLQSPYTRSSGEEEGITGLAGVCQVDWAAFWSQRASPKGDCRRGVRVVESERNGDVSGAPVPDFGPDSLLLAEAEFSIAKLTCRRAQTSYVRKGVRETHSRASEIRMGWGGEEYCGTYLDSENVRR
jgi:hypothetical protein